jgi:hypothetical protein
MEQSVQKGVSGGPAGAAARRAPGGSPRAAAPPAAVLAWPAVAAQA